MSTKFHGYTAGSAGMSDVCFADNENSLTDIKGGIRRTKLARNGLE